MPSLTVFLGISWNGKSDITVCIFVFTLVRILGTWTTSSLSLLQLCPRTVRVELVDFRVSSYVQLNLTMIP